MDNTTLNSISVLILSGAIVVNYITLSLQHLRLNKVEDKDKKEYNNTIFPTITDHFKPVENNNLCEMCFKREIYKEHFFKIQDRNDISTFKMNVCKVCADKDIGFVVSRFDD